MSVVEQQQEGSEHGISVPDSGLWMVEMSEIFDGVGLSVRKPRGKVLHSFRVLIIPAGKLESTERFAGEGSCDNKAFHPR